MSARGAQIAGDVVVLDLDDGRVVHTHRLALRDSCPCPDCRHPLSGQRLFDSPAIRDVRPEAARIDDGALIVNWRDGHRSVYGSDWIEREAAAVDDHGYPPRRVALWGAELAKGLPRAEYGAVVSDPAARRAWLDDVARLGFAILKGVPTDDGTVASVAELFGHVRVTNYGRVFDVRVRVDAANLADTSLALSLHTDNPYRDPVPTVQLLHCLSSDAEGGETVLADGFRAVEQLAATSPRALAVLAEIPIRFSYRDQDAELAADVPIVTLDALGRPSALHVNNRSKGVPVGSPERVGEWYDAYFLLLDEVSSPRAKISFRLEPGDVVTFDNLRVLHGRTGFSGEGHRRLQGCYADRDALYSTLAVLDRGAAR
jgi:gamma-butyrobetaine dioxygenase